MNAMEIGLLAALALGLGAAAYAAARSGWRLLRADGRLRLSEAVNGQGLALPEPHSDATVRALGIATRRCMTCAEHERCDELLEAGDWITLREVCPNTAYIDGLRRP